MLDAYQPINVLLALWPTPEFEFPSDPAALGERLRTQFPSFSQIQIIQMAGGGTVPPELAQLILISSDRQWALELAPAKVCLRRNVTASATLEELLETQRETWLPMQSWLSENLNLRIYRLGLVMQFFCQLRASANEKIAQYFLQQRGLQGPAPHEVHLDLLTRITLEEGSIANRWIRVRPLRTADARRLDFAAQIEVDLNTQAEDTRVRTARDLTQFIESASKHIARDIPLFHDPDFIG